MEGRRGRCVDGCAGGCPEGPCAQLQDSLRIGRRAQEEHQPDNLDADGAKDQGGPNRLAQLNARRIRSRKVWSAEFKFWNPAKDRVEVFDRFRL